MDISYFTAPFVIFLISISLIIVSFTMFVNFVRGFALIAVTLGLGYYAFASNDTKKELNAYSENLYQSIIKKDCFLKYENMKFK